ncbi:hypothetical protein O181_069627 [Austropuccinia psidii MF-1]|uniref:Integrase catalytic domain-containing protein n=1 Tax=Austropuccinia psidii MF-1 TaxID=1389203 RepID=A0A9Q3F1N7_9BASI|nr:hypothetical protein [Austropuccinia psidii MF-1]
MDWVTALPPGGDRSYKACLVLAYRYIQTPMSLPCHKDDTSMDIAIMILNKAISHTGLFQNIITYHPQTDGLEGRMLQNLGEMIRRFCAYVPEFKDWDGSTHDWCTLEPGLKLEYKTSVHSSTGKTPEMLKTGWNPRLPYDTFKKCIVDINQKASRFKMMVDKARQH